MIKLVDPPDIRRRGGATYYKRDGQTLARTTTPAAIYQRLPPSSPLEGGEQNASELQRILGAIRGAMIRNFNRINRVDNPRPDWRWNSGLSPYEWTVPNDNPREYTPRRYMEKSVPSMRWQDSIGRFGIWHDYQEFGEYYQRMRQFDFTTPAWQFFIGWYREYCRWRWIPGAFPITGNLSGVITPDQMCISCFECFRRAGYVIDGIADGDPPQWCQYQPLSGGIWNAYCIDPTKGDYFSMTQSADFKRIIRKDYDPAAVIFPNR